MNLHNISYNYAQHVILTYTDVCIPSDRLI